MLDVQTVTNGACVIAAMTSLDIVTGVARAAIAGEISSAGWFRGLLRKSAIAGCFALAVMLEWAEGLIELGVTIPLVVPVASYIALTEATSTYENLRCIDPALRPATLEGIFAVNALDDLLADISMPDDDDEQQEAVADDEERGE